jgi:hypothetical protein
VVCRQYRDRFLDHLHRRVVLAQPQFLEHGRQQIDTDPTIFPIEHHARDPIPPQASGEGLHPLGRVLQVVQNADAYNQVEVEPQCRQLFDREQMQFEVLQSVLVIQRRLADVHAHDFR